MVIDLCTLSHRDDVTHYYTELEIHAKFCFVYPTVSECVSEIRFINCEVKCVESENMMFLKLIKLKRNTLDFELSVWFGVNEPIVSNIFCTGSIFIPIIVFFRREVKDFYVLTPHKPTHTVRI